MIYPKITIVTVVYNSEKFIRKTIQSVLVQNYPNIEYLIIDGKSTDKTLDIIKDFSDPRFSFVSEKDKGVYDAMNKGIDKANGDWIIFMNAGDYFYSENAISSVFNQSLYTDIDVIYGDAEFRLKNIAYIEQAKEEVDTNQYMPFSHQAAFVKTSIAKKYKFDLDFKITADAAFFLKLIKSGCKFLHVNVIICSYNAEEGLSADNDYKRSLELVALQAKYNSVNPEDKYFQDYIKKSKKMSQLKKIVPNFIWIYLREKQVSKKRSTYTINE